MAAKATPVPAATPPASAASPTPVPLLEPIGLLA